VAALESSTTAGLLAKRDISDSDAATELDEFLAAKGSQLELNTKADQCATVVALSFEQDNAGAYTALETDELFVTSDASAVALSGKRDKANSYTSSEVDGLLAVPRPIAGAVGLQESLDARAFVGTVTAALSFKIDKEGSISPKSWKNQASDRVC